MHARGDGRGRRTLTALLQHYVRIIYAGQTSRALMRFEIRMCFPPGNEKYRITIIIINILLLYWSVCVCVRASKIIIFEPSSRDFHVIMCAKITDVILIIS